MEYCQYCGAGFKRIGSHARCCKLNPDRDKFLEKLRLSSDKAALKAKEKWKDKFNKILEVIKNKGGECLTKNYSGYSKNIKIRCSNGHEWEAACYSVITRGNWCKACYTAPLQLKIADFHKLAKERFGKCLTKRYTHNNQKILWQCNFGHKWRSIVSRIKLGSWCPTCASGLSERICRLHFETIFNNSFIKTRPKWLIGNKGIALELDGYCEKLGIAFEHNGGQHYRDIPYFKCNNLMKNDVLKKEMCDAHGVKLLIIKELFAKTSIKDLKNEIKNQCISLNIELPQNYDDIEINYNLAYKNNHDNYMIDKMKDKLRSNNMELLDSYYLGVLSTCNIKCLTCSKIYNKSVSHVLSKPLCDYCENKGVLKSEIESCIKNNGGKLISNITDEKIKKSARIKFTCKDGHVNLKLVKNLITKNFCIKCFRIKNPAKSIPLHTKNIYANKFGGVCLDSGHVKVTLPSKWKCSNGHEFECAFKSIRRRECFCIICEKQGYYGKKKNKDFSLSKAELELISRFLFETAEDFSEESFDYTIEATEENKLIIADMLEKKKFIDWQDDVEQVLNEKDELLITKSDLALYFAEKCKRLSLK